MTSEQRKQQLAKLFGVYDKRLEKLYDNYIRKMTQLAKQAGIDTEDYISKEGLFRFEKYPELNAEFKSIFDDCVRDNLLNYKSAITSGVTLAFSHQASALSGFSILSDKAISLVRDNAAQTFLRSRLNTKQGLNLSQLVWNYAQQGKSEFEVSVSNVISDGLKKGTSAEELGRKIREYLNNPDMMYRRYHRTVVDAGGNKKDEVTWRRKVKDEEGKTRFVEEPLENVGSGHYRSSRKNATRLMRTEINMAYLRANWERWQKEPFVTGIHIHLSPQHPDHDECDELEGYYPKDFLFIGWHPQCLCTSDPITIYGDEKKAFYRRMAQGEDMSNYVSPNAIKDVPDNFKKFVQDNRSKFISAGERGKLGYVWKENLKYVRPQLSAEEQARMGILNTITTSQPTSAFVNSLIRLKNLLPRDIQNAINNGIDKNQLPIIGKRVSAEIKEKEVRILNYAREFTGRSKVIDNLVNDYKYIKGIDRLEALDKIREKCAIATRYDLRKALNIDSKSGLVYDSINKDFVLQKAETKVVNGKTIKIPEKLCDVVVYRDSFGKKYGFELAYNKLQPDAKEITDMIKNAPSWARKYFNSLYFMNDPHPMDLFFKEAYKSTNFTMGAMYSGEPITVHWSYRGAVNQFKEDLYHEIGHHIDHAKFISISKEWVDARLRDRYIFRDYSKNRPNEDFADAISWYLTHSFSAMNMYFPNRLAVISKLITSL